MDLVKFKEELLASLERPEEWFERCSDQHGDSHLCHFVTKVYLPLKDLFRDSHQSDLQSVYTDGGTRVSAVDRETVSRCLQAVRARGEEQLLEDNRIRREAFLKEFPGFQPS